MNTTMPPLMIQIIITMIQIIITVMQVIITANRSQGGGKLVELFC